MVISISSFTYSWKLFPNLKPPLLRARWTSGYHSDLFWLYIAFHWHRVKKLPGLIPTVTLRIPISHRHKVHL
jgi:hypothetical protein